MQGTRIGLHGLGLGLVCMLWVLPTELWAQPIGKQPAGVQPPAQGEQRVNVDHARLLRFQQKDNKTIQQLTGEVELSQDSVFMYCDSAIIENGTQVFAIGRVIIQQGDSISAFADSLFYDGTLKVADLIGHVILVNSTQRLYTDRLHYDLNTKLATYTSGATLVNDSTQLTSKRGFYFADTETAFFKDSVVVIDPRFQLRADTLQFNARENKVNFLGPTIMRSDSSQVYCEAGFYDVANNEAEFRQRAQYQKGEQRATAAVIRFDGDNAIYTLEGDARFEDGSKRLATADVLRYNQNLDKTELRGNARVVDGSRTIQATDIDYDGQKETYATRGRSVISDPPQLLEADSVNYDEASGLGIASGEVIWQDTSQKLTILCATAGYKQESGFLKASGGQRGRPLLMIDIEGDTLFMTADTLLSMQADTSVSASDSSRLLLAYHDVRILKSDLQALADSVAFSQVDDLFRFYRAPVIWSDTSQFSADTIHLKMTDDRLDRIFLYHNSFIINSPDEIFFNQIKGKQIEARFDSNELRRMNVSGNAESIYYAQDEKKAYVGVNKTVCSEMVLNFGNNQVTDILFFTKPSGRLDPMSAVDHKTFRLDGFNWQQVIRPRVFEDLFGPPRRVLPPLRNIRPAAGASPEPAETTTDTNSNN